MRKFVLSVFAILLLSVNLIAQDQRVSGTVTSEDGTAIAGVTVIINGTNTGTVTNAAGKYSIAAPKSATIHFSFIGLESQEIAVGSQTTINVKLLPVSAMIDDINVIHVAFGTAKKEAFTGSAAVIDASKIAKSQSSNISQTLAGAVPGLQVTSNSGQPGTAASIRIRGLGSYMATSAPLFIIDGVPYDGGLENINPSDIESMTVLKDASSNALYGARGANGVIMITTKRGKSMEAQISVDAKWGVNSRAVQEYDIIKSPAQYYETHYNALYNFALPQLGNDPTNTAAWANKNMITKVDYGLGYNVYTTPTGEALMVNGKLNPNATLGRLSGQNLLRPDNWYDAAFNNSMRQEYNISISGASEKSNNYFSLGYLKDEGYAVASDFSRITARLKSDYQAKSWLKVGASVGYTNFKGNTLNEDEASSGNTFAVTRTIAPIYPLYIRDKDGNIIKDARGLTVYDYGEGSNGGMKRPILSYSNPISDAYLNENSYEGNAINGKGFAEITFLKDFKAVINAGIDIDDTRTTDYTNPFYGIQKGNDGMLYKGQQRSFAQNYQQLVTYTKSIANHNFDILVGHETYSRQVNLIEGKRNKMFSSDVRELSGAILNPDATSSQTDYNTEGYLGRAQYNYDNKYFFSASLRRDASSRFHPDNRWGNFWSVGGAWLMNKEKFMQNVKWIDMLKIKASYGSQGNDGIGSYSYVDTYTIKNSAGQISTVFAAKGNKDIKWETNYNFNVGTEFAVLGNRITGSIEYFSRKTTDLLFTRPVSSSLGYSTYPDNIGSMSNRGIEIDLTGVLLQKKNIYWTLSLNATHYKNKFLSLPPEKQDGFFPSTYNKITIGSSRYEWYMPKYAGVDKETGLSLWYKDVTDEQGKVTERKTTDVYTEATKYSLGSALPDLYGGISTSIQSYGFDFSINLAYQIGGLTWDYGYQSLMASPSKNNLGGNWHKDISKAWTKENADSNIPRLQYDDTRSSATSDRFLISASYINIQNISFGYTLPTKWTSKISVNNVRIFLSADNVALFSKRQGLDPRQEWSGENRSDVYSPIRTVSGGVSFKF